MKKIGLICATLLTGLSLSACNNMASHQIHKSSSSSSIKVTKHHKVHKKHNRKRSSVSSAASISSTNQSNGQSQSSVQNSSTQSSQISNSNNGDPHLADGTDVYDLPLSDPRNPDSYKQGELMDISGDPKYQNPDGSVNAEGSAKISSIESTFHQPQN